MPYLTARALDRANEWLVSWRLSGRLSPHLGPPIVEHLRGLGDAVHPAPESLPALAPRCCGGSRWQAPSPWPTAAGRNAVWCAERVVPRDCPRPDDAPVGGPSLLLLHGWLLDRPQLLIYRYWARQAALRGIDVWMPRLPHHMERAEAGEVSGQRLLSPNLSVSLDGVRQAVAETRSLARWLRRGGASSVGVWGMSLGGWVAALAATLDADWDAVALWAPVASPAEVLFHSRMVELLRDAIVEGGLSEADFAEPELAPLTPVRGRTSIPRSKILAFGGIYDQVVAPRSIARMARHWNFDVRWVPHGHISLMASRASVKETVSFLDQALV